MTPSNHSCPNSRSPFVTFLLILSCAFAYFYHPDGWPFSLSYFGVEPINLLGNVFSHVSIGHLVANSVYLCAFGPEVEDRLGHLNYLVLFLFSGIVSSLAFGAMYPDDFLVGASGAISGVMGVYMVIQRGLVKRLLVPLVLGASFLLELYNAIGIKDILPTVAYIGHLAGGAAGLIYYGVKK